MIDYTAGGRWQDVIHALAIIESNENPAATGDGGQAFGLIQQHPAFFAANYGRVSGLWNRMVGRALYPASTSDTWVTAQIKAAASFLEANKALNRTLLIESYHQGVIGAQRAPDPSYFTRFAAAFAKIGGHWPA